MALARQVELGAEPVQLESGPSQADQAVGPAGGTVNQDIWLTKDGRELNIGEMYRPHLGNAQAALSKWLKAEKDPLKRRELKSWRSRMRRELAKREKAWRAKRKKEAAQRPNP